MNTIKIKDNLIVDLSFNFGLAIVEFTDELQVRRKFAVANQLLRSGTSVGANIWESQNAESKRDFIHKLKIAAKEGEETEFWLLLCKHSKNYPDPEELLYTLKSINKILNKIISTSKKTINSNYKTS
ncbi:MAG: four helix bundle protein [Chitinophagaceae bacterium]|nr:four helix bundle protein [Chitinophagaceae bacterium]